jgi:uncharacterized Zn-binding protein involved in type VI secretion
MPGYLLDNGATVMCTHSGQAQATVSSQRVKAGGQPIVTQSSTYSISGCPFNVSGSPVPCVTGQWITAATRVMSDNVPVLLQDSQSVCTPNGTPMTIVVTQMRVKGT